MGGWHRVGLAGRIGSWPIPNRGHQAPGPQAPRITRPPGRHQATRPQDHQEAGLPRPPPTIFYLKKVLASLSLVGPLCTIKKEGGAPAFRAITIYGSAAMNTAAKETPFSHVPVMVSRERVTFQALLIREIVFLRVGVIKGKLKFALDTPPAKGSTSLP